MVYIVNAEEELDRRGNQAVVRNRLFTAITRSKAWARVCGVGPTMEQLKQELTSVAAAKYELNFTYPTEEQLAQLRIVHREVSRAAEGAISDTDKSMRTLLDRFTRGEVLAEDIDPDILERLRQVLGGGR